ncbi:MAG: hypothetical protein HOD92_03835 [Deltaproteobacteria bacterium]|nr:hypothetical protein [Deltaproteobacteria bacterium]MBT4526050.1 hypothetical protein [Deltaproteobacteria bacterium]
MIKTFLIVLLCFISLPGCYLLEQTSGQLDLRFNQIKIDKAIQQEENANIKNQLREVPSVKQFAEKNLHLQKTENYTGYYHTDQVGITFVVTASPKDKLEPYTWWFPIIGRVPYKGFFDKADALKLEKELQSEGFDTWLFAAPTYSSIGWFKDPITTPMLKKGLYYLIDTIIHEMVHVTLYVNDQGDFNEQLAVFVAHKGAFEYLKTKTDGDLIIKKEIQHRRNRFLLHETLQIYLKQLEELYSGDQSITTILQKRAEIFKNITTAILKIFPHSKSKNWQFNNARLLQLRRYQQESPLLKEIWEKSNNNWENFWDHINSYIKQQKWD